MVGKGGLEPPKTEASGFTVHRNCHYATPPEIWRRQYDSNAQQDSILHLISSQASYQLEYVSIDEEGPDLNRRSDLILLVELAFPALFRRCGLCRPRPLIRLDTFFINMAETAGFEPAAGIRLTPP